MIVIYSGFNCKENLPYIKFVNNLGTEVTVMLGTANLAGLARQSLELTGALHTVLATDSQEK